MLSLGRRRRRWRRPWWALPGLTWARETNGKNKRAIVKARRREAVVEVAALGLQVSGQHSILKSWASLPSNGILNSLLTSTIIVNNEFDCIRDE